MPSHIQFSLTGTRERQGEMKERHREGKAIKCQAERKAGPGMSPSSHPKLEERQEPNYFSENLNGAQPCHNSDFQPPQL